MSHRTLTYHFTLLSPWSYLGHAAVMDVVRRHHVHMLWRPISLMTIFPQSGGLPLARRHPKRQAYRDVELQRWRFRRELPLNLRPAFWPVDIRLADRTVIAIAESGADPDSFVRAAFAALWAEDANLAEPSVMAGLLSRTGHDPVRMSEAETERIADLYDQNSRDALDGGVFGAPTYSLDGEPFWGQDRVELLDEALTSGRAAFAL